jgi:hypothetical protein
MSDSSTQPAAAPAAPAAETAGTFVVVADAQGIIGAYASADAAARVLAPYCGVPFVYTEWPHRRREEKTADGAAEVVWVFPYAGTPNAVAYATDDPADAEAAQRRFAVVDLVVSDDIAFRELALGTMITAAARRLADFAAAREALNARLRPGDASRAGDGEGGGGKKDGDARVVDDFLTVAGGAGAAAVDATARLDLLQYVVPLTLPAPLEGRPGGSE